MNKQEFINALQISLKGLPDEEITDIMYDYEEHFTIGMEKGKSEENIANSLGEPNMIGKQYKANYALKQAQAKASTGNILKAIFAGIGVGLFNLYFVLGLFLSLLMLLLSMFAAALLVVLSGASLTLSTFTPALKPLAYALINVPLPLDHHPVGTFFLALGITCSGLLFIFGDLKLARLLYLGTIKYLKFNLKIINKAKGEPLI